MSQPDRPVVVPERGLPVDAHHAGPGPPRPAPAGDRQGAGAAGLVGDGLEAGSVSPGPDLWSGGVSWGR